MVVVPLSQSATEAETPANSTSHPLKSVASIRSAKNEEFNWIRMAAVGSLVLGGVLIMKGKRRAGLVSAVSGTALAMLDQQDSLKAWWETLPVYLDEVQLMLARAQGAVEDVAVQRDKLHKIFTK